eukprot:TRINITY_DN51118_c0_g1_i1.p1 TRINITY_DN51118_c0_g1~~TRINITY_DN51118_c0_g1_i1.p1  ORF type:complete len:367 (+),score=35.98 TRINITY_DN51118_c0_g1_i1:2-1102(+)
MLGHALLDDAAQDDRSTRDRSSWRLGIALALATGLPTVLALGWLGTSSLRTGQPAQEKDVSLVAVALPRYAYLTFHGDGARHHPAPEYGINTVLRFDLDAPQDAPVAVLEPSMVSPSRMLRDVKVLPDGTMLVVQGYKYDSAILEYGACSPGGEPFRPFVREYRSPQLVHPYAIALMGDEMFASTQDSNTIIGFNMTKVRMKLEEGYSPLVDFNVYGDFRFRKHESYRGIACHENCIYVSVVNKDRISVMCRNAEGHFKETHKIKVKHPIGLLVDDANGLLYIASVGKHEGHVGVWDIGKKRFLRELVHEGMAHPTNMAFRGDTVLVLSMTQRALLEFSRTTGAFLRVALSGLPPSPECLALGNLC